MTGKALPPQEVAESFKRRLNREILLLVPVCAGMFLAYEAVFNPGMVPGGWSRDQLLTIAMALELACAGIHFANWRCPACGWPVTEGLNAPFCPRCRSLFVESEYPATMDPASDRQARVELALEADQRNYRNRQLLKTLTAAVLIAAGAYVGLVTAGDRGGWLPRRFGDLYDIPGALRNLGGLLALAGLAWMGRSLALLQTGSLRRAEQTRRLLSR